MADAKISQLTAATALAGTEVVPIVQSGITKKATISQILSPAAGQGINFSANGGDVLTQYDEGTWTPVDTSGAGLTITVTSARYTRIGRQVSVNAYINYPVQLNPTNASISLPFKCLDYCIGAASGASGRIYSAITIGSTDNVTFRDLGLITLVNGHVVGDVLFSITYMI